MEKGIGNLATAFGAPMAAAGPSSVSSAVMRFRPFPRGAIRLKHPLSPVLRPRLRTQLLGVASVAAAVRQGYLEATGKGTVIFFNPGEGGSGKAFMAREGVFDGIDVALTWHPASYNAIASGSSNANVQVLYKFKGVSAHAAGDPHLGRSALDAVELMNVGVQFLREHMVDAARIHYAIMDTGGYSQWCSPRHRYSISSVP